MVNQTLTTRREAKMLDHPVASRKEWLAAREALLEKEKEFTAPATR
jgi:predicted dithiol-disulfide oxidoreductase (DUF899 family)